ncbi:hypothetical protein [Blastococcus sp. CCUG 61487]|uniref:hypothetical protein n=1 Tax=Blastococcus sp. CCUG 61487 TaxID=1840703 RepID=UPI0010C0FF0E|nr:hypothetical protein [Blastococcus sp. CCUG 61487]TKJ24348.1 hypothetical protein A6V29_04950 [Blastococcus sp. CCUG 61487]
MSGTQSGHFERHLWEVDHPYYSTHGNYFSRDYHAAYGSWVEFVEDAGDDDLDMNLVYRWDWQVPDPDDYEPDEEMPPETLDLFYVGQRKAIHRSVSVTVQREDEPAIRDWLIVRAEHMRRVWEPLL